MCNFAAIGYVLYISAYWLHGSTLNLNQGVQGLILWKAFGGYDNGLSVCVTLLYFFVLGAILQRKFSCGYLMAAMAIGTADYLIQFYVEGIIAGQWVEGAVVQLAEIIFTSWITLRILLGRQDARNFLGRLAALCGLELVTFIIWRAYNIPLTFYFNLQEYKIIAINLNSVLICGWVDLIWIAQMGLVFCLFFDLRKSFIPVRSNA